MEFWVSNTASDEEKEAAEAFWHLEILRRR